ncbi:Uncharacterised protein [Legionella pneumophila]|nr:Uncharacterised protein [Legionella pneumophila]
MLGLNSTYTCCESGCDGRYGIIHLDDVLLRT